MRGPGGKVEDLNKRDLTSSFCCPRPCAAGISWLLLTTFLPRNLWHGRLSWRQSRSAVQLGLSTLPEVVATGVPPLFVILRVFVSADLETGNVAGAQ